jgi:hypothetical protein
MNRKRGIYLRFLERKGDLNNKTFIGYKTLKNGIPLTVIRYCQQTAFHENHACLRSEEIWFLNYIHNSEQ